jgi:hypothetical protein
MAKRAKAMFVERQAQTVDIFIFSLLAQQDQVETVEPEQPSEGAKSEG